MEHVREYRSGKRRAAIYRLLREFGFSAKKSRRVRDWSERYIIRHFEVMKVRIVETRDGGME